ncbi:MAG: 1-deoxy-D-xylulose-5-phosphate reductoisomerase [Flavobacteriales bacterium]|nr:1-deoxy-D-xylulose-5-phosphate reductoisomerase [Flavobacteriales bacterium]|tara:strand:+ start:1968 stop:3122 length:1155 start_codon:yes stop_codon:yes gene_type:complete
MKKKKIGILGSTGSIGTQALSVISELDDYFEIEFLTANKNAKLLVTQSILFSPKKVVIVDDSKYIFVKSELESYNIKVYSGSTMLNDVVQNSNSDLILVALVGYSGLLPTISAIDSGKNVAIANKETLVVAGKLITEKAKKNNVKIIPVDSEHSAIFQCLQGEMRNEIEKIYLTASGGPFRGMNYSQLQYVTKEQALNHPNWSMGNKVTIDSSTLMNKGLEVIEAKWLFSVNTDQIEVIIHPQSVIHSMVQFRDGSIIAQLGLPDMKLPIQFALTYPKRLSNNFKRFNFKEFNNLTFESPDIKTFKHLKLAFDAIKRGGNVPCTLNAANEVVVNAFLHDKLKFHQMSEIINNTIEKAKFINHPSLEDYIESDKNARLIAKNQIK